MSGKPDIEVLVNNRWIQGVRHRQQGLIQVIFYRAGSVKLTETVKLTLDSPGALMIQMEGQAVKSITASDPSRRHDRLHLTLTGKLAGGPTELAIDMPVGVEAGSSVSLNFRE
jgi:hypothetical protein